MLDAAYYLVTAVACRSHHAMMTESDISIGLGLPSAPEYRPTEEEFLNPLEFIAKIRPEAEKFGICKVIPPSSWNPPFMVDTDRFSFDTRIQSINELQNKISTSPEYKAWNTKFQDFLKVVGKEKRRNPTFCGREIDLFKFHKLVAKRGGYQACCDKKVWREVARLLGVCLCLRAAAAFDSTLYDFVMLVLLRSR
jgi:[histone H3]-trimethyl-L-lysine4 demethylase